MSSLVSEALDLSRVRYRDFLLENAIENSRLLMFRLLAPKNMTHRQTDLADRALWVRENDYDSYRRRSIFYHSEYPLKYLFSGSFTAIYSLTLSGLRSSYRPAIIGLPLALLIWAVPRSSLYIVHKHRAAQGIANKAKSDPEMRIPYAGE